MSSANLSTPSKSDGLLAEQAVNGQGRLNENSDNNEIRNSKTDFNEIANYKTNVKSLSERQ